MNEIHRQTYLSALGVDTYMPRFHLPFAPVSVRCEFQPFTVHASLPAEVRDTGEIHQPSISKIERSIGLKDSPVGSLMGNLFDAPKTSATSPVAVSAASILAQLESKPITIEPFNLSIWRPLEGLMIVDSRNTKLALPTEMLLQNILRGIFPGESPMLKEEVLRWPAIENSFAKRSAADARTELQTWLSVQYEIRPIRYLLLMGENAATYFLAEGSRYSDISYQSTAVVDSLINALILPSLNELLQMPLAKKKLQQALRRYLSVAP